MRILLAAGIAALLSLNMAAQTRYASGQDVVPVFEGWERNPDGTFNLVFGYMNRNYEEQVDIPIGPNNRIEPGPADQGQPEHFYRRRQQFMFKVKVPADFGKKDVIWTLVHAGKTEKAYGSLLETSEIGNLTYQENRGGPGDMNYPEEPNKAPTIEMVGSSLLTAKKGEPIAITVAVSDDGHPKPRVRRGPAPEVRRDSDGAIMSGQRENPITQMVVKLNPGATLGVTWTLWRGGPVGVDFEPMRSNVVDGKATTKVSFDKAGTYRLRAYADDGILLTPLDISIKVED
jgi:hypothetical protein